MVPQNRPLHMIQQLIDVGVGQLKALNLDLEGRGTGQLRFSLGLPSHSDSAGEGQDQFACTIRVGSPTPTPVPWGQLSCDTPLRGGTSSLVPMLLSISLFIVHKPLCLAVSPISPPCTLSFPPPYHVFTHCNGALCGAPGWMLGCFLATPQSPLIPIDSQERRQGTQQRNCLTTLGEDGIDFHFPK